MPEREVWGWVWPMNVRPLLSWAGHFVGYEFDETDWQAVEQALAMTDSEAVNGWYDYPLVGRTQVQVAMAREVGAEPVQVRFSGEMDDTLAARLDTLLAVLADVRSSG